MEILEYLIAIMVARLVMERFTPEDDSTSIFNDRSNH